MEAMDAGRIPEWTIGDRLKKAREFAGLEQIELAEMIEASRQTIGNYESNAYTFTRRLSTMRLWAMACGVDPGWIDPSLGGPPPWTRRRTKQKRVSACTYRGDFRQSPHAFFPRETLNRAA